MTDNIYIGKEFYLYDGQLFRNDEKTELGSLTSHTTQFTQEFDPLIEEKVRRVYFSKPLGNQVSYNDRRI